MDDRKFSQRLRDWRARERFPLSQAAARLRRRGMDIGHERLKQLEDGAEPTTDELWWLDPIVQEGS